MNLFKKKHSTNSQPQYTVSIAAIDRYKELVDRVEYWRVVRFNFEKYKTSITTISLGRDSCSRDVVIQEDSIDPIIQIIGKFILAKITSLCDELEKLCRENNIEPPDYDKL